MGKKKNSGKAVESSNENKMAKAGKTAKTGETDKVVSFSENLGKHPLNQDNPAQEQSQQEHFNSDSASSTSSTSTSLPYDRVDDYKTLLELQSQVMDELYQLTEDMLQEHHYQADKFSLNEDSAMEFLDVNMHEFISGEEESLNLVFDAEIEGESYKTFAFAFCRDNIVLMDGIICKYDKKNDDWLMYTGEDDKWDTAPEDLVYYLKAD